MSIGGTVQYVSLSGKEMNRPGAYRATVYKIYKQASIQSVWT